MNSLVKEVEELVKFEISPINPNPLVRFIDTIGIYKSYGQVICLSEKDELVQWHMNALGPDELNKGGEFCFIGGEALLKICNLLKHTANDQYWLVERRLVFKVFSLENFELIEKFEILFDPKVNMEGLNIFASMEVTSDGIAWIKFKNLSRSLKDVFLFRVCIRRKVILTAEKGDFKVYTNNPFYTLLIHDIENDMEKYNKNSVKHNRPAQELWGYNPKTGKYGNKMECIKRFYSDFIPPLSTMFIKSCSTLLQTSFNNDYKNMKIYVRTRDNKMKTLMHSDPDIIFCERDDGVLVVIQKRKALLTLIKLSVNGLNL